VSADVEKERAEAIKQQIAASHQSALLEIGMASLGPMTIAAAIVILLLAFFK
jgi:hypothetical protein